MLTRKSFLPSVAIAFALSCWSLQVNAQADAPGHAPVHAHDEHGGGSLSLSNGQQWETDEALRHGMLEVRVAVAMMTPAFESGQLNNAQAEQLSKAVQGSVNTMIEQCKLEPEADADLHGILAELPQGSAALEAAPLSSEGLPALQEQEALETYGQYFNHVGWEVDGHTVHTH